MHTQRLTQRLTMAQALVRFLDRQYLELDGKEYKLVAGILGIFGHGNATGIGEALEYQETDLVFVRGNNEQGMVHAATAYAKQRNRLGLFACTSSIGPGATNMVTGAATATINRLPVLLLPGDVFADRQPDPVLQQLELPNDASVSVNDCFRPVSRYWDRILRPEQLMSALIHAFRVLTDPVETGAVTLCLPQDTQAQGYDYPASFLERRVWHVDRRQLSPRAVALAAERLRGARRPLIIAGGGVHYSLATQALLELASALGIPVAETQAGKGALPWHHPLCVGGIGVTGTLAANRLAARADLVLVVGSRLSDFTSMSKRCFAPGGPAVLHLNVSSFDGGKLDGQLLLGDARDGLIAIREAVGDHRTAPSYSHEIAALKTEWECEVDRLYDAAAITPDGRLSQTAVLGQVNRFLTERDVVVSAAGSLPGDLHRLWRCERPKAYHLEYGYSCMGYEVAGALGVKLAEPDAEVWALVGDGSFLMLHSELLTSLQERRKINVVLLDNSGFQCIQGLQKSHGSRGFGNELRYRDEQSGRLEGERLAIDFAAYAKSLGAKAFRACSHQELDTALAAARASAVSTLIEVKVVPESMTAGYESWWRVGVAEVSSEPAVEAAARAMAEQVARARRY